MKSLSLFVLSLIASLALFAQAPTPATTATPVANAAVLSDAQARAAAILARVDLAAYRGWIKFLRFEALTAITRHGLASEAAQAKILRLDEWTRRILADPQLIGKLRGVQEWAYESPADDSGQPFKVMIPTNYDPARPTPVTLSMHGYSGNHLEHSSGMAARPGDFEITVLGRARGGWYIGLSQADVLHALDYLEAHWNIDPDRIRLAGGSMGGGATFKLGARYPHRFASGQITCGYAQQEPLANLLTFPIYATHSDDDWTVPILHSRGPLARLRQLGGQAIFDETTGLGHAAWNYAAGNERSGTWAAQQVRPASATVRHLDFTALDGNATRAWWAEVAEWGPAPQPAHFALTAGANNTLFAELTNVDRLRLRLDDAPFDRAQPLQVVINGRLPLNWPAPLPGSLILARTGDTWSFENAVPAAPQRLHTPGGPLQLYNGEPLLIVYGTSGNDATRTALRSAAEAAGKSSHPDWLGDGGEAGTDGVPHAQNLYGRLNTKADTEVTDGDLQRCHLVLIGTAAENTVVAKLAGQLPVTFDGTTIVCSDGVTFPGQHQTLGLVHFNPLAPQRLLFWVASGDPAGYAAGATVPELGSSFFIGADLLITDATAGTLAATRSFNSHWQWTPGRDRSPLLPATLQTHEALRHALAESVRLATGADFGVAGNIANLGPDATTPGVTRVCDLATLFYAQPIDLVEITGAELLADESRLAKLSNTDGNFARFYPAIDPKQTDPTRLYRIALPMRWIGEFGRATHTGPRLQWRTDTNVAEALAHFLVLP